MRLRCIFCASAMALAFAMPLYAGTPKKDNPPPAATDPKQAIERGLQFLEKDAAKWRKEKQCATCHHGVMTVWAFAEAQIQGYKIAPELVADVTKWTKERLTDIDKPRDTRPGWKMVNTPAMYLANMALAIPKQEALSADELKQIAGHLLRHQEGDGSWAWSSAPAKNRPPPHFESDEVATLLASMALGPHAASDLNRESPARDSREKASAWLAKNKPGDDTQAALLRLVRDARAGKPRKELDAAIDRLVARQNKDGGWGQLKDLPSDAYATGQTLYYLRLADAKEDRPEIQKAVAYLTKTQSEDGSWPMKSRAHPGEKPFTNPVPITYFGSAWATMGLMRSVILPSGTASAQDEKPAKEMITKEAQAAIDAGIAYLAKQQMDDGAWGTRQYPKNVGITSFAGLAFLSAGHRPGQGPPPATSSPRRSITS
jgi:hypothetical protein